MDYYSARLHLKYRRGGQGDMALRTSRSHRSCCAYFCRGISLMISLSLLFRNFPQNLWQDSALGLSLHFLILENLFGLWDHYFVNQKSRIPRWRGNYGLLDHFCFQWKCLPSAKAHLCSQICSWYSLDIKVWKNFPIKIVIKYCNV